MQLVLATTNVHKIREFRSMLKNIKNLDLLSLRDFPNYLPPRETGDCFEENAKLKASHAADQLQLTALADDSGLVVPALQGAPGVFSARYAGLDATDRENRKKLLLSMIHLQEELRDAYFECWIAIASPSGILKIEKGVCEGRIVEKEHGSNGFGYDSIFRKHEYSKTLAELHEDIKNRISHRRKALDKVISVLR